VSSVEGRVECQFVFLVGVDNFVSKSFIHIQSKFGNWTKRLHCKDRISMSSPTRFVIPGVDGELERCMKGIGISVLYGSIVDDKASEMYGPGTAQVGECVTLMPVWRL